MGLAVGTRERVIGAFVGLAAGDALGVPVEFEPRSARQADPVRGMRGGGTWKVEAGTWSDDTSLALCLAESIVERAFDPEDSGRRSVAWLDEGLWSARGEAFDVGGATRRALDRIRSGVPAVMAGGRGENDNGNGSLMRMLPASIWLAAMPEPARFRAIAAYSSTTHGHPRSMLACWLHCLTAGRLLWGEAPAKAYASAMAEARSLAPSLPAFARAELGAYSRVLDGSLPALAPSAVRGSGYVLHCLEASLWCLTTTQDFASCVLAAVNLGEDADTTGAVAGGLAGLAYGRQAIPEDWAAALAREAEIEALAGRLSSLIEAPAPLPRSYWALPGKILAGGYPGRGRGGGPEAELSAILGAGIDAFVDLTEAGEERGAPYAPLLESRTSPRSGSQGGSQNGSRSRPQSGPVLRRQIPTADMAADPEAVRAALGELDSLLSQGRTVYLHCLGGLGRTGTVLGSYFVDKGLAPAGRSPSGSAPNGAVALLGALRAATDAAGELSPQTEDQLRLLASRRPGPAALPM
jgi:ADP-ribosyl-[dinitrogen reductase] hydrolase